jgi:hypothetical protein
MSQIPHGKWVDTVLLSVEVVEHKRHIGEMRYPLHPAGSCGLGVESVAVGGQGVSGPSLACLASRRGEDLVAKVGC